MFYLLNRYLMKFYLSSYRIGNELAKLQELTKDLNKKVAYISNALDFTKKIERKLENERIDINQLEENGLLVDKIDLCEYF